MKEAFKSYAASVYLDVVKTKDEATRVIKGFLLTKNISFYYDRLLISFCNMPLILHFCQALRYGLWITL